ncbi:MAG: FtsW/RodA/SpoVE family cell cycle protein [Muribaculaceae bacterium]|nr:FtsW/RodA/SpoVE family cell cycle protein [Muribaculaceae bacterium]
MPDKKTRLEEVTRKYGDPWIWGIYITLVILSIVESYSAASREVAKLGVYMPAIKQCTFLAMGGFCVFLLYRVNYNNKIMMGMIIHALMLVTVVCLVYVLLFGEMINGAQRAINLPGFTLQPAELAKLSIVTMLAFIYARNQTNMDVSWAGIFASVVVVALFAGLLIQSGLTNTLLIMLISLSMMVIGGTSWRKIGILALFFLLIVGFVLLIKSHNDNKEQVLMEASVNIEAEADEESQPVIVEEETKLRSGTWSNRLKSWSESNKLVFQNITNKNQQEMFSRIAQAHGGIHGVGIGNSRECARLPLAFSDYIYSIIVEETGFVGGIIVLLLYLCLMARAIIIVRTRSHRALPSLLLIGLAFMIVFQALFHMAINTGVFPVSGQPLPLVSMGGSSIIVMSVAFGIMLSVSRTLVNTDNNAKSKAALAQEEKSAREKVKMSMKDEWK